MSKTEIKAAFTVMSFVSRHPELDPERVEDTISVILADLKRQKLAVTVSNMEKVWKQIIETLDEKQDEEIEGYRAQIDSWSADEMREYCKDPEVLAAVESVLNSPRPKAKETPKPQPKAKPPVKKDPLEASIDAMSADEFKKSLLDPARARGIEATLRAVEDRRRGQ